jgi:hypothetical protein
VNLDKVAARLRARTPYEAMDLGIALARRFWKPLILGWLVCTLPLVVGAGVVMAMTDFFWLPLLAIWWLKPLYDRVALFVLSRAFFGDVPELDRTVDYSLKSWRSLSALADLTWRRFSPQRAVSMPVRELERLGGSQLRERLKVLLRRDVRGPALWLMFVCLSVEVMLIIAAVVTIGITVPDSFDLDIFHQLDLLFELDIHAPITEVVALALYYAAMSVVEVLYVAASFGLYINRRVRLEGWDIEIVFRRLAHKLSQGRSAVANVAAALLVVLVGVVGLPSPSLAQQGDPGQLPQRVPEHAPRRGLDGELHYPEDAEEESQDENERAYEVSEDPQQAVDEILEAPEFGSTSTEETWQLRDDIFGDKERDTRQLEGVAATIAMVAKVLLWIAAAAAIGFAVVFFWRRSQPSQPSGPRGPDITDAVTTIEAEPEQKQVTLPANLIEAAVARWEAGEYTQSLSMLYRGTIRGLAVGYGIEIDPSQTARECADKVAGAGGPGEYVAQLAAAWTATVYADRRPTDEHVRELFARWRQHFRSSGGVR